MVSWRRILAPALFLMCGVSFAAATTVVKSPVITEEISQFGCGVQTFASGVQEQMGAGDATSYRWLSGLEPERISDSKLAIQAGSVVSYSGKLYSLKKRLDVDLNGVNAGTGGELRPGKDYFIYLVGAPSGEITGALVSSEVAATTIRRQNAGVDIVRKLPWGFIAIDGKIPAFHLSFWPKPFTRYTMATQTRTWQALDQGTAGKFKSVDLSHWLPDNARLAYVLFEVSNSGSGDAYVRVSPEQGDGFILRGARGVAGTTQLFMHQRVNSKRQISYRVDPGVVLNIYVFGYSNTEPS